jgi:hypothetical protein
VSLRLIKVIRVFAQVRYVELHAISNGRLRSGHIWVPCQKAARHQQLELVGTASARGACAGGWKYDQTTRQQWRYARLRS